MKTKKLLILGMVLPGVSTIYTWQETRTPLSLFEGYMHYPLDRDREMNDWNLDVHYWTGIYFRTAPNAYNDQCPDATSCSASTSLNTCCSSSTSGSRKKESLAALYFGESSFTFEQAFANSAVAQGSTINPLVLLSPVTFNIDYREQGVWFGTNISTHFGCNNQWNTGLRVRVPFRDIKVQSLCGNPIANADASFSPNNLFQQRVESISVGTSPTTQNAFAVRLDALTALNSINFNTNGATVPLVTFPTTDILIAGQNASGGVATAGSPTTLAPFLSVIESTDGSVPYSVRWADIPANGATVLQGDGSGLSNLQRGRVASDISYASLASNNTAESHLFVVPNVEGAGETNPGSIIGAANTVFTSISNAFNAISHTSLGSFTDQVGLNACYGNTRGMGDTNFELYIAHDWKDYGYLEGRLWITAPTGIKVYDPLQILKFPTGNNGHPEVGLGIAGGIEQLRYLAFNFDAYYIWVTPARNNIAAPFVGASVKNIGPCVSAKTSWNYGLVNVNMNIINPYCECMGVMFGYEGFFKGRDKLCLINDTAIDFAGNAETLDPCIYEQNTDRVANKIRTEAFFNGECFNTFLGFTATVAGKNIPAEVDFHIGLDVYF